MGAGSGIAVRISLARALIARARVPPPPPPPGAAPAAPPGPARRGPPPRPPPEGPLRMTLENLGGGGTGGRKRRRALLQPAQDVAGPDQDDDGVEPRVPGQDALEDEIERLRSDSGARDVAHVHVGGAQIPEVLRRLEDALERPRPARGLIEGIPLGLTPTGHQDPVQPLARAHARHFLSPLSFAVDLEPDERLELREHLAVDVEMQSPARREDAIEASMTHPPAGEKLARRHRGQQRAAAMRTTD